jgi:fumarate reductase flavoprotein subunit
MQEAIHEVLITGGGVAGLTAAARCAELGLKPVLLEQGMDERYPCNSRSAGGILHVAYQDIASRPEDLAAGIRRAMGSSSDEALISEISTRAAFVIDWLNSLGTHFVRATPTPWHRWTLAPPRPLRPGLDFPGSGPDALVSRLIERLLSQGGQILRGHRVQSARRSTGCYQVVVKTPLGDRTFETHNLVLADGGFQGNPDLVRRYISPSPERLVQRGAGTGSGVAIDIATSLGADLSEMNRFYGHPLSRDALHNPRLWPYPMLDSLTSAGMVVDPHARRWIDEGRGGVFLANHLAARESPDDCLVIFDQAIWESAGRQTLYPANPYLEQGGATIYQSDSLEDLARQCGLEPAALVETVRRYNRALAENSGQGRSLEPPRSGTGSPVETPPFRAVPMTAGITNTMGGVRVGPNAQAVARDGTSIAGLYAVGASAGGLEGGTEIGYVGGLMRGLSSGLAAAQSIAESLGAKSPAPSLPRRAPANEDQPARPYRNQSLERPEVQRLRMIIRHSRAIAACAAVLAGLIGFTLGWTVSGALAGLLGIAGAIAGFGTLQVVSDLVRVVLYAMVPESDDRPN